MYYNIPRLLLSDAYTVGSGMHVSPEARELSGYHVVARRGFDHLHSFVEDSRMIFYGLQDILKYLFSEPITYNEIYETERFLETFHAGSTQFYWDKTIWERVVRECNRYIPITIEALPEGSVFFPYEPVMQITAKNGFGELANYFESTLLKVWSTIERVTVLRWWHHYLTKRCMHSFPELDYSECRKIVDLMCHDFGDRASSCTEESIRLGLAHLMVFPGTDTTSAAYYGWYKNNKRPLGHSIHALAHRTIMGFMKEEDAHIALFNLGKHTGITAHVSDTYNYYWTVRMLAEKLVKDPDWRDSDNIIVVRPDSGDPVETVLYACRIAREFGVEDRMRWIQGDSMNFETMIKILDACEANGFNPFKNGAFGVGGYLRNSIARDHSGFSMKLAYVGKKKRPVVKGSETVAKQSIPGKVIVQDNRKDPKQPTVFPNSCNKYSMLTTIYDDGKIDDKLSPLHIKQRIHNNFLDRAQPIQPLSNELIELRKTILDQQTKEAFN